MSTPLQQLVLDRLAELNLSFRQAAAQSGGKVSSSTLNNIALGRQGRHLDDSTLQGIALACQVTVPTVREAAGADRNKPTKFVLPKNADRLTDAQRRAVRAMISALLSDNNE